MPENCRGRACLRPKTDFLISIHLTSMLRATRLARTHARGFATVVDAAGGAKVAAVDNGQPTSSVTVLLKAGSRYEQKPGVAHVLSNFAFKVRVLVVKGRWDWGWGHIAALGFVGTAGFGDVVHGKMYSASRLEALPNLTRRLFATLTFPSPYASLHIVVYGNSGRHLAVSPCFHSP